MLLVAGLLACSGSTAWAKPLRCGDTVTTDTTLRADLTGCPGNGLVIGADGITLDLNGHTITGNLNGAVGIDNSAGHDGVTIKNGAVRNFTNGVQLNDATGNRVQRLTLVADNSSKGADNGVLIFDSDHNQIEHNSISGSVNGIFLGNTTDSTVDRNRVSGTHNGILLLDADRNAVTHDTLVDTVDNGVLVFRGGANVISANSVVANVIANNNNTGIGWYNTTGGRVAGNRISGHSFAGLAMESDGTTAVANVINDNGGNIILGGNGNVLRENVIRDARGCKDEPCGEGISVEHGTGNLVTRNLVIGNALDGIGLDSFDPENSPATGTVIRGNVVRRSGQDGISVGTETDNPIPNTRIAGNHVSRSADDGIDVARAGTLVAENTANLNGDLGISAVLGVIDGGGNHAFGNGNPAQCINIAC